MNCNDIINSNMIAPCGLNCALCHHAQQNDNTCQGCNGPKEHKANHCRNICGIVRCEKLLNNGWDYCDQCDTFPCEEELELETRYTKEYPLRESPFENIAFIRKNGMEAFLAEEKKRWTCSKCGGVVCVHTGKCSNCD